MANLYNTIRYDWPLHFVLVLSNWAPGKIRGKLARPFLGKCGRDLVLGRDVVLYNPRNIEIGESVYLSHGVVLLAIEKIAIKDDVVIGERCVFSAGNHSRVSNSYRYGPVVALPINVGKGTQIGYYSSVLGGAEIGEYCSVDPSSVIIRGNYPDRTKYAGVPAVLKTQ